MNQSTQLPIEHPPIGSTRDALETPCLVLDLDVLERNIDSMLGYHRTNGVDWRPHSKCYKSTALAKKVLEAGAIGLTCAKLGEAEVMARAGFTDLLIANQLVGARRLERLVALRKIADPIVIVDDVQHVDAISRAAGDAGVEIRALVEVDIGLHRCGTAPGDATVELARRITESPGLKLSGIMGYEGHLLNVPDLAEKESRIAEAIGFLNATKIDMERAGLPCPIVSAGGTGSYLYTARQPGLTEIQAGGGIFMDLMYRNHCKVPDLEFALTILATVTSRPAPQRAIIDAGRKTMNQELHVPEFAGRDDLEIKYLSAEHGFVAVKEGPGPAIGERLEILPGYCDFTTVLHDHFYCFRGERLEAIWPLEARGCLT